MTVLFLRMNRSRLNRAMTAPAPAPSLPMLWAELVELGREAWRIHERERAVRAKIQALQEIEENEPRLPSRTIRKLS
jgi:hypothetical protein